MPTVIGAGAGKTGYRLEGTMRQSVVKEGIILDRFMYAVTRPEWTR
jgi:RimJ/RimL family protein N-acetyltransferase